MSGSPTLVSTDERAMPLALVPGATFHERLEAFTRVMREHNQRLYRVARAVVRDATDAEEVVRQAYVSAYLNAQRVEARCQLSTWLTRIVIHEAYLRLRQEQRILDLEGQREAHRPSAEQQAAPPDDNTDTTERLEHAVERLSEPYRIIVVLREVEGLGAQEAAQCLSISEEAAHVRLLRARGLLRAALGKDLGPTARRMYEFGSERSRRIIEGVRGELYAYRASHPLIA